MSQYQITPQHYYHPRYWPLWFLFGLGWSVAHLPYSLQLQLGKGLGKLAQWFGKTRRHAAERNLEVCFPNLSKDEQKQMLNENFKELGIGFMELSLAYWGSKKKVDSLCHISGLEHLKAVQEQGQGAIIIAAHMISLELCLRMFSERVHCAAMYKPAHNEFFEIYSHLKRARYTKPIPNKNMRPYLQWLRKGGAAFYLPDQHYGSKNSVFAPFFGIQTMTVSKTPEFIKITNARVLPVIFGREKDGYHIELQPPIDYPSGDVVQDATTLNQWMEKNILKYPTQYLWQHRRFKSRPEGEPSIYKTKKKKKR